MKKIFLSILAISTSLIFSINAAETSIASDCNAKPTELKVVSADKTSITISFKNNYQPGTYFELRAFKKGKFSGNINGSNVGYAKGEIGSNTIKIKGLSAKSEYDLVLRAICPDNSPSTSATALVVGKTTNKKSTQPSAKKELKTAENAILIQQFSRAGLNLAKVEPKIELIPNHEKAKYYLLKGQVIAGTNKTNNLETNKKALNMFSKSQKIHPSDNALNEITFVSERIETAANNFQTQKDFSKAEELFEYLYNANPSDTIQLYKAAGNAVNQKKYDVAINHYKKLLGLGFTGVAPIYKAKSVATGKIDIFASKEAQKQFVEEKKYVNPTVEMSNPLNGEITKNIALIYYSQGKIKEAEAAFTKAKAVNPNDKYLKEVEAGMYTNMAIDFNKAGNKDKSIETFKKALALTPNSTALNSNIANIILSKDQEYVNQLNSLGRSKADQEKYKVIEVERNANFVKAAKYLENYLAIKQDKNIASSLLQIYTNIKSPKATALKAKYGL